MSDEIKPDEVRELPHEADWPGGSDNTAVILNEPRELSEPMSDAEARKAIFGKSRRNFLVGGAAALIGIFGWRWMPDETKYRLLRGTFEFNEWVSQNLYSSKRLAPEFPESAITAARVNGDVGLTESFEKSGWRFQLVTPARPTPLLLSLADLELLPRTQMITELKCIEGWSIIVHWEGVRFSDFARAYSGYSNLDELPPYVSLTTPADGYYVGWDTPSILHPQTLLAYMMNGQPLTAEHGSPLRLASPLKYGIKQIKRIGRIEFTNERPRDYWAEPENGYDWYSGH